MSEQVGADLAAVDPLALIKFSAFISLNLAVVNALPVPGLGKQAIRTYPITHVHA